MILAKELVPGAHWQIDIVGNDSKEAIGLPSPGPEPIPGLTPQQGSTPLEVWKPGELQPYYAASRAAKDEIPFDAEKVTSQLEGQGIGTRPFFWPIHEQPVFRRDGSCFDDTYPNAEWLARRGLYLPSGLGLVPDQLNPIARALRSILV